MTKARKQDSNFTSLAYVEEASIGTMPANPTFAPLAPNSYKDFGGKYKSVARNPINASRQRLKGVLTDLDAMADFQCDLTYENTQNLMQGVLFANFRTKNELAVPTVDSAAGYEPAAGGASYNAGDLAFGKGFQLAANNGLKLVTGTPTGSSVEFAGMASESGSKGVISRVGFQFASGDAEIDASGALPALTTTTKDLTTLGLIPGEWLFVGDDAVGNSFANAGNTCFVRISTIAAHRIVFDKFDSDAMATDTGTGKTIRVYFSRVLRNEQQASIVRRTYTFERQLPSSDSTLPMNQAEYVTGAAIDTFMVTVNTADKVTWDLSAMANQYVKNGSDVGPVTPATRLPLAETQAYNTSTDVKRSRMSIVGAATPLFAYLSTVSLTVKNNIKQNKAISVLGAFDQSAGMLEVSMAVDAYFTDVEAVNAISNNSDVTVDLVLAHNNTGIIYDLPLVALGDGALDVKANEPITLKLTVDAASAATVNPNFDYTVMVNFFDYLPTVAM